MIDGSSLNFSAEAQIPTMHGAMLVRQVRESDATGVVVRYDVPLPMPIPVRVQSSCLFSESLGSIDCDCADQLKLALAIIAKSGGYVVYVYEEGRGAGLEKKIEAIKLQDEQHVDTAEAFRVLGMPPDPRDYGFASRIIRSLIGSQEINLLTNDPNKVEAIRNAGISVFGSTQLVAVKNEVVKKYLDEKARVLGHEID